MPTIIECNVSTGTQIEREMTPDEIAHISAQSIAIPISITALQGLLAIDYFGLASKYEEWANSSERTFAQRAFIDKAQTWNRDDLTLNVAATSLGLTSVQLDEMFILASTL